MSTDILILCTHNSARSILAEGMLDLWANLAGVAVRAHSAGSTPSGIVNPHAIAALRDIGIDTTRFRSKSWDEFVTPDAPRMRAVITVCDNAAAEACPWWPGSPVRIHWSYPDPSAAAEDARAAAFELTRQAIGYRMRQLIDLPFAKMSDAELQAALEVIGRR